MSNLTECITELYDVSCKAKQCNNPTECVTLLCIAKLCSEIQRKVLKYTVVYSNQYSELLWVVCCFPAFVLLCVFFLFLVSVEPV